MSMQERWLPIVGFEGYYEVSDLGRVRSLARVHALKTKYGTTTTRPTRPKILKGCIRRRGGYRTYYLMRDGVAVNRMVQSLVLEAFVGPRPARMQACHFDGDTRNNALSNLRWDTSAGNHNDKKRHGTVPSGAKNYFARLSEESVREIKSMLSSGKKPPSIAPLFRVHPSTIYLIKQGKTWQHV